jgi:trehalose 6-phosphate phosphatase
MTAVSNTRHVTLTDGFPQIDFARDALIFDVDGTLLDIADTPDEVDVPSGLRKDLHTLSRATNGALAIISGRPIGDIDTRFAPLLLPTAGCHGAEMRLQQNGPVEHGAPPLSPETVSRFKDVPALLPGVIEENKIYTLAFHYRMAPQQKKPLLRLLHERLMQLPPGFELLHGKAIAEIKSGAFNKGTALRRFMNEAPFSGRRPVFFGDDTTDEDAFAALGEFRGLGVSVGRLLPGAQAMIETPQALREKLSILAARHGEE